MHPDTRVVAAEHLVSASVGDELVLLDLRCGIYYGLNESGTRIWQALADGLSIAETVERLAAEHDVPSGVLERDVLELVGQLMENELIGDSAPLNDAG